MSARPLRILVAGMVAGDPWQGGATWAVLQYVLGLERLGHEVVLAEPVAELQPESVAYFSRVVRAFGLAGRASLVAGTRTAGLAYDDLRRTAARADVVIDASGMLRDETLLGHAPIRVYLDLDPAFNQLWHVQGVDVGLEGHTHHATVGMALGSAGCTVPDCGVDWIPVLPPVLLELWRPGTAVRRDAFTTVGNWRSYGPVEHDGVRHGLKAHSLRELLDLPARTRERIELALAIDSGEAADLEALRRHGFVLLDPRRVAGSPAAYRRFVRGSRAELGIAKEGYVVSRSGWFGDRSACYLAAGRPVLAQDTGFGGRLPTGAGLFAFDSLDAAAAAAEELRRDYGRHARAARAIAEEFLDARVVLRRLLEDVGAVGPAPRSRLHDAADEDLAKILGATSLVRRPARYRSSAPLAEVDAALPGGRRLELLVKDLAPEALVARAVDAKPAFLHDPLREIETYQRSLETSGLGTPAFHGAVIEPDRGRYWLLLERVRGTELTQVGELERWSAVAAWLARLHDADLPGHERLVRYDAGLHRRWLERARSFGRALPAAWEAAGDELSRRPPTLIHGELYPSNVLVADGRVCAVDWELAGVGQGLLDLAALITGWTGEDRDVLVRAYDQALVEPFGAAELRMGLAAARLQLAVRWLGWSSEWTAPPEHRRDWLAEARAAAEELGL